MSNLKRAFSMVMALVMVLGMITIPAATAAEGTVSETIFSDANEITYGEAVAITGGIGLFSGTDGKFLPKGTVTRAQMATIIVKMLYGADANADSFKGEGKFIDTAYFEGGWAEGYINWCATLGIVSGYGDGTFKPGNEVTTAEAATMILNALKVDAGEGTWPTTVMSKAAEEGMFKGLKSMPGTNKALNREQLAVVALNGLNYSPAGDEGWYVSGGTADDKMTFDNFKDANRYATLTGGQPQQLNGRDTLAFKVYDLKKAEGWITANQSSVVGANYTELTWFEGGKAKTTNFNIATDDTMLGHKVELWYKEAFLSDKQPGEAFAVVETAEYVTLLRDAVDANDYKTALGRKELSKDGLTLALDGKRFVSELADANAVLNGQGLAFVAGTQAPAGTYVIDIESGDICGYIAPASLTISKVSYVDTDPEYGSISVGTLTLSNVADDDEVNEYEGIAKDDLVSYTQVQEKYTLTKLETITGAITKHVTRDDGRLEVTIGGEEYITSAATINTKDINKASELNKAGAFTYGQEYLFYLTADKALVGYEMIEGGGFNIGNTFFVLDVFEKDNEDGYGVKSVEYYARGIDMTGNEAMIPVGVVTGGKTVGKTSIEAFSDSDKGLVATPNNFYTVEDNNDSKETKELGLKTLVPFASKYNKDDPSTAYYTTVDTEAGGPEEDWGEGRPFQYGVMIKLNGNRTVNRNWWCNVHKGTTYIVLDGTVDQHEPLTVTMLPNEGSEVYATGALIENRMLVNRQPSGAINLEVMVLLTNMDRVTKTDLVYVAAGHGKSTGSDGKGYTYSFYNALTGEPKEIVLKDNIELPVGFYSVGYDSEEEIHRIVAEKVPAATNETYLEGNYETDGRKYENVLYDAKLVGYSGSNLSVDGITGQTACSGVKVIDVREDEEVAKSGIARITSMDQLWGLIDATEGRVRFELDLCVSSSKVVTVFVEVYNNSNVGGEGSNTVVYYDGKNNEDTDGDGNAYEVVVLSGTMYDFGHVINLNEDVLPADLAEGIYKFSFGTDNEISMSVAQLAGDVYYSDQQDEIDALGEVNTFNAISSLTESDLIEYVYVEEMNLLVTSNAVNKTIDEATTEILAENEPLEFAKVYDKTGVMGDLADYNFVEMAKEWAIDYRLYETYVEGQNLLVVDDANYLDKNGDLKNLDDDDIVAGKALLGDESLKDVVKDKETYDVSYIVCDGKIYIQDCDKFEKNEGNTLSGLTENLRLTQDTALTAGITVTTDVVLDLNGYNLYAVDADAAPTYFTVSGDGAKLTIRDSKGDGSIMGVESNAAMIYVATGELVLEGGTLTGHNNTSSVEGGAVYVGAGATFTMTGGAITGNKASYEKYDTVDPTKLVSGGYGGGVFVGKGAKATIAGGTISGNSAAYRGGGITSGDVTGSDVNVTITGTAVVEKNNATERGGNLYFFDGKITIGGNAKIGSATGGKQNTNADNTQLRGGTMTLVGGVTEKISLTTGGGSAPVQGTISGNTKVTSLQGGAGTVEVRKLAPGANIVGDSKLIVKDTETTVGVDGNTYFYAG